MSACIILIPGNMDIEERETKSGLRSDSWGKGCGGAIDMLRWIIFKV
jgi:hypothetical protein